MLTKTPVSYYKSATKCLQGAVGLFVVMISISHCPHLPGNKRLVRQDLDSYINYFYLSSRENIQNSSRLLLSFLPQTNRLAGLPDNKVVYVNARQAAQPLAESHTNEPFIPFQPLNIPFSSCSPKSLSSPSCTTWKRSPVRPLYLKKNKKQSLGQGPKQ